MVALGRKLTRRVGTRRQCGNHRVDEDGFELMTTPTWS